MLRAFRESLRPPSSTSPASRDASSDASSAEEKTGGVGAGGVGGSGGGGEGGAAVRAAASAMFRALPSVAPSAATLAYVEYSLIDCLDVLIGLLRRGWRRRTKGQVIILEYDSV